MTTAQHILANRLWPQTESSSLVRNGVLALAGAALVAAAAQITIPVQPVPFTMQTCAVLAVGAAFGSRLGALSMAIYAILGAFLPIFQNGTSGWLDSKAATFLPASSIGYIFGFVIAAWIVGKIVEGNWGNTFMRSLIATLVGAAVVYVPGVLWLAQWASISGVVPEGQTAMSAAIAWGLTPFVLWDAVKAAFAGLAVPALAALLGRKS